MKVCALATIEVSQKEVPQGSFIDIPEADLPGLSGKVAYIKDCVLRVPHHVASLEAVIVGLTTDNLVMQKEFLIKHCQAFGIRYIDNKWKEWEKRVTAMQLDKQVRREEAEIEAASELNLLAFLKERKE